MKLSLICLSILFSSIVQADVDYFIKPPTEVVVLAGETVPLEVSQLPDIDGKAINANVYAEGSDDMVMTIRTWSGTSVSDDQKNNFAFDWPVPSNLCPGRYYVKIDIKNDQDDNDICRSKTIEVHQDPASNHANSQCGSRKSSSSPSDRRVAGKPASSGGVLGSSIGRGSII